MKRILAVIFLVLLFVGIVGCTRKAEQFRNQHASGGEVRSSVQGLFVHSSGTEYYLNVNGKTYRHVRGSPPFYLNIPALQSVLFVTGEVDHEGTIHLVNLATGTDAMIVGAPEDFGWEIGSSKKPGEPWTDYIANATTNRLTLIHQYPEGRREITLNLDSKKIERIKTSK